MTTKRWFWLAAGIGFAVPLVILMIDSLSPHGWWPRWVLLVWPAAFTLGAASGTKDFAAIVVILVAALSNAVLYGVVAGLLSAFAQRAHGPKEK